MYHKMASDVRIDLRRSIDDSEHSFNERPDSFSQNDKLVFFSLKIKDSVPGEDIQGCVLDEIVRLHGNKVFCTNEKVDGLETNVRTLNLPFPESSVKKIAIGNNYIGVLLYDGRVCRIRHEGQRKKSAKVKHGDSSGSKESGNGTGLQIASDEIFARTLQNNIDRQNRVTSRPLLPNMMFPSRSHDPRLSRLSRRYEPYSLGNRGRRLSLIPSSNLFDVEERAGAESPYRSNCTNIVFGPRSGQVLQFQRVPGGNDFSFDNLTRHIPVIIGQTLRPPDRVYSEPIRANQPSLEDALNAHRNHSSSVNTQNDFESSELNDSTFALSGEQAILPDVQQMSPLISADNFEEDSFLHRPSRRSHVETNELPRVLGLPSESPEMIRFIGSSAPDVRLSPPIINSEGENSSDGIGTSGLTHSISSSHRLLEHTGDTNIAMSPLCTVKDSIATGSTFAPSENTADNVGTKFTHPLKEENARDKNNEIESHRHIPNIGNIGHRSGMERMQIPDKDNDTKTMQPEGIKKQAAFKTQSSQFHMDSILSSVGKQGKSSGPLPSTSCESKAPFTDLDLGISLNIKDQSSEATPLVNNSSSQGKCDEGLKPEYSPLDFNSRPTNTIKYPRGFRPMGGSLNFMEKRSAETPFLGKDESMLRSNESKVNALLNGWPEIGILEWLDDGVRYIDIAAMHSEFLLVTQKDKTIKSWRIQEVWEQGEKTNCFAANEFPKDLQDKIGLNKERVKMISSSILRATILTENGLFATLYDRSIKEKHNGSMPALINQLSHPCQKFESLEKEEVVDIQCSLISTCVLTRSGKVYWWGLPPNSERQLFDKRKVSTSHSRQDIKTGDIVRFKKQYNEVGSLVLKISDPLFPTFGIVKHVLGVTEVDGSEHLRTYLVDEVKDSAGCQKRKNNIPKRNLNKDRSFLDTTISTEDDEIKLINFSDDDGLIPSYKGTLDDRTMTGANNFASSSDSLLDCSDSTKKGDSNSLAWKSSEVLFLEESASNLGKVIAIDGQFAVVSPVGALGDKDKNDTSFLSNKAYKVFFLSTVEKIIPGAYSGTPGTSQTKTRYGNILESTPKLLFGYGEETKYQALCMANSKEGLSLLVKKKDNANVYLIHPKSVKEDNSKWFTCSKSSAMTLESLTSEANATQDYESVDAKTTNLDFVARQTGSQHLHGKRKVEDSDQPNEKIRMLLQGDDLKPKLRMLNQPLTTFLFDNQGCPYSIKFLTSLKDPPQLECGPLSDFNIVEYPFEESRNERIITIVAALKPLHLIPLIIYGNKEEFTSKIKAIETEVKKQKATPSLVKRSRISLSDPGTSEKDSDRWWEGGRQILVVDEIEAKDDAIGSKGKVEWLEQRCSGNQNLLHICAANITSRNFTALEKQYFDMFHDEVFMLNSLLESTTLWPWISKLLVQRDANGCTPFMTALMCKNHHAAYYILKAIRRHDLSVSGMPLLKSVLYTPSFSGITPIHKLIMNANRRHHMSSYSNALRVTNIPTSYTPRMLLKLFKSRYASAYRASIPIAKSRWRPLTVRAKVKAMFPAKENENDTSKLPSDRLSMPSSPHTTNQGTGGYFVGTRLPYGGERLQRANAIRASAKEGMIQFSNTDEMFQALAEMNGYGVLSKTDHPSGVLTSVVQHVLNVQLFEDQTQESTSRSSGAHSRRFQPIPRSDAGGSLSSLPSYPYQSQATQGSRSTPVQSFHSNKSNIVTFGQLQEQPSLSKNRVENIAKCFDDIVGCMVLTRLLLLFPEIGAVTSSNQETALHTFFKHINRCQPSPLSVHFLLWRPCRSQKCCYKTFTSGFDITPASENRLKDRHKHRGGINIKRRNSDDEIRDSSETNFLPGEASPRFPTKLSQESMDDAGLPSSLVRTFSSQSTDSIIQSSSLAETVIVSEYGSDIACETESAKTSTTGDFLGFSDGLDVSGSDPSSSSQPSTSTKMTENEILFRAKDTKNDYLDPAKDTFMAPSPSIMKCKVLENVDLDQLDDRSDNLVGFGDTPDSGIASTDSDPQLIGGSLHPSSYSSQITSGSNAPFISLACADASGLSESVPHHMEDTVFRGDPASSPCTNRMPNVAFGNCGDADILNSGTESLRGEKLPWPTSVNSSLGSKSNKDSGGHHDIGTSSNLPSSPASLSGVDCMCQKTSQKLPLFDRFQAPIFQLAKNWPCIVASILGSYRFDDKQDTNASDRNSSDETRSSESAAKISVNSETFLPSAKLDVFTEALLSSPFDILLEFILKILQSKLEGSCALLSFELIKNCIESKLSSPESFFITDSLMPLFVAQRFVRSVVRHMSLFLGKHAPMEINLRYKIRKRGKNSSKKEERMLLGLNVCLKAFSWLSVIELLRAAVATIEPVCSGTVKAQPKAIVSGLMGNTTGQMRQNILFRPNIRIHGPQSQSSSFSTVIGRMAMRTDVNESETRDLCGTQFTHASHHESQLNQTSKGEGNASVSKSDSESDSEDGSFEPMEFRTAPSFRASQQRNQVPEAMVIVDEDEETPPANWNTGVRIRPDSPSAWALNGHVTAGNELNNRLVNRLFGSQPQENKQSAVSLHHGNCYLARIFSRLVKEAVDLVRDLIGHKEGKGDTTKPFEVKPIQFPDDIQQALKEYAQDVLANIWSWLAKVLNSLERQLQIGQEYDTVHFVTRLQVPENELEHQGLGRPSQSYTYISQPEEYLLYLIKSKTGDEMDSLPVLDLLSYSHITFVLDAFIYTKKYWPQGKDFTKKGDKKGSRSGGQSHGGTLNPPHDVMLSEEHARFLGEHISRGSSDDIVTVIGSIGNLAKNPHAWLKLPHGNGQNSQGESQSTCLLSDVLIDQESKDKMNENQDVRELHSNWKLTISSFCKLFLTEPPGYERESFLALEAGAAGRISRFQRSVATLRTSFKSDNSYYSLASNQESSAVNPLLSIIVKRSELMEDCLKVFLDQMDNHPYGSLRVRFEGEEGAGPGVNRGLFASFANCLKSGQKILNWPVGLLHCAGVLPEQSHIFTPVSGRRHCVQGNEPFQGKMTVFRRRMVFVAIGRFLGLTLWFNQTIPLVFSRGVLKYLLHREDEIAFEDLAFHSASMFSALGHILVDARRSDMTEQKFNDLYCLRFEAVVDGTVEELIPGGSEIAVVPENLVDYLRLYTKHLLVTNIDNEMEGMREGLQQIIPRELLDSLTPEDLQLLLSGGVENVDLNRLKSIITFSNSRRCPKELFEKYTRWFWRIVRKMTPYQRQQLLHFATGSSVLPALDNRVGNNEELAITVDVIDGNINALPMASTCGQRISLPLYPSKKILKRKMLQAIECQAYGLG